MAGCLCLHGFTGAPYEVEPIADYLRHLTDWEIRVPCLPGHGETASLKGVAFQEWIDCAENELKDLLESCEEVYVIGFSMGGMIASYLAAKYPVSRLILMSAAAYYVNPRQFIKDIRTIVEDGFKGLLEENTVYTRYRKKIRETPILSTLEFRKLVRYVKPRLHEITIPVLIIQGECDGIVPIKSAHYIYREIGSDEKKLCFLPSSTHLICHGEDFGELAEETSKFLGINPSPDYQHEYVKV
ncbi:alpha/beta fold hydrolase [Bacillus sp. FJAT-42376]|uniref:alpha/beta hydrolase n=1 Tax=Bacillus sp. FJAT-42376 TaxID=2014076 RepID=UPI000F4EA7F7|nr:alpha/beta fold hydrolase [Bacillus sp. FJAT-42376]AZB41373.1 alpha/beta fold hydrolase [Bacillus sp. FJAT-42376]